MTEAVDVVCFSLESGTESGACPVLVVVTLCVPVGERGGLHVVLVCHVFSHVLSNVFSHVCNVFIVTC